MRVGVNLMFLERVPTGGTETYVRELLPELEQVGAELVVFTGPRGWSVAGRRLHRGRRVEVPALGGPRGRRVLIEQTWLAAAASRRRVDVLFSPGYVAPLLARVPLVTTIPDALAFERPELLPPLKRAYWRMLIPLTVSRSRAILTLSESSAEQLRQRFPRHGAKMRVTYLASCLAPGAPAPQADGAADPYFLTVAQHLTHKNIERVLRAVAAVRSRRPDVGLMVVGPTGPATHDLERVAGALGAGGWVRWHHALSLERLEDSYRRAVALVTVSQYEGFCLPVVEAMAVGCPVVCSDIPALVEIAGGAARHVGVDDVTGLVSVLAQLLESPAERERLAQLGRLRALQFSWRRAADETLAAFKEAMA
ncbi:MAG: glycosyltransferase family 4 protein [Candidatus Rokuibacteriota bacterium]